MGSSGYSKVKNNSNKSDQILKKSKGISYIKCTYDIKDNNFIQILNNRGEININEEIESKIKILNSDKKEPLVFKKKFNKLGMNTIIFIIEENLVNMSF